VSAGQAAAQSALPCSVWRPALNFCWDPENLTTLHQKLNALVQQNNDVKVSVVAIESSAPPPPPPTSSRPLLQLATNSDYDQLAAGSFQMAATPNRQTSIQIAQSGVILQVPAPRFT